jgi:hypothetical protein
MSNPNFSTILATTIHNYRKELVDNIFKDRPLAWWLMDKKRTRMEAGGVKIVEQLLYAGGQANSYTGYDQLDITPQTGISAAEYDWKQIYASVIISRLEELQNSGEQQVINLLKAKIFQAEETLKDLVNTMLWADGTGNSGKHWAGLRSYIHNAPSGAGTVGGIDQATQAYWRNTILDAGTAAALTLAQIFTAINTSAKGNDKVDAMFTSISTYGQLEALFQPAVQYEDVHAANAGFDNITVKRVPVFFDNAAPASTIFGINSKYLTLVGHKDDWFVSSDFMDPAMTNHATSGNLKTVNAKASLITATGNLVCSNRARQFVIFDLAA